MRSKFLYGFALLSACSWSCINPVYPAKPTLYLTKEFKDFTDFKAGSYWIYEESKNSANQDSIAVIFHNQLISPSIDGEDGPGPFEEFTDTLSSSIDGKFMANADGMENDYHVQYTNWPNYETTYFTLYNGVLQFDDWGNMTLTDSSENLNVAGKQYQSVKEFTVNPQGGYNVVSPITHIYWARNVGVVEKTISGTTWQLIRYHVIQ